MTQLILFNVTNGLIIGAFYVLMALGLSLILNLSNVINFAHGNFLALGGYLAFVLTPYIGFWGALLVAPLLTAIDRPHRRAAADPPALRPRSALQPAADLRPGLHHPGRAAASSGAPQGLPLSDPAMPGAAALERAVLHHLVSRVHGRHGDRRRSSVLFAVPALHAARHAHPRRHARPRDGGGARRQRARCCARSISRSASSSPASPACWPPASSASSRTWATTC